MQSPIPLNEINKVTVKQGLFYKNHYHLHFYADRNYHFIIYDLKDFSTQLTGDGKENLKAFINMMATFLKRSDES